MSFKEIFHLGCKDKNFPSEGFAYAEVQRHSTDRIWVVGIGPERELLSETYPTFENFLHAYGMLEKLGKDWGEPVYPQGQCFRLTYISGA